MKRSDLYPKFKKFTPRFFWTKCEMCGEQFKKEPMLKIASLNNCYKICIHCADNCDNVALFLENPNMYNLNKTFEKTGRPGLPDGKVEIYSLNHSPINK